MHFSPHIVLRCYEHGIRFKISVQHFMGSDIASVHERLLLWAHQGCSIQNAPFHRKVVRSTFLYSGSVSHIVQATGIAVGCIFFVILQDTRFLFPN